MKSYPVHAPILLALLCANPACDTGAEADVAADKADLADEAEASGKADQLDLCVGWDWYDDDFCDDPYGWCAQPDPDCGPDGDSCAVGWTWSGRPDEGCVEAVPAGLSFESSVVIGRRASTSFDARAWAEVAVDASGGVHAVYSDFARRPTYARPDDGWAPHALASGHYVAEGMQIVAAEQVHVAYVDDHYRLQHLVVDDAEVVDREEHEDHAYSLGMSLDGDAVHFVYGAGQIGSALVGRAGGLGSSARETIASFGSQTEAREGPVVAARDGLVHALYLTIPAAYNYGARPRLRHVIRDGSGAWTSSVVPDATTNAAALTVGPDGTPWALYNEDVGGTPTLVLATYGGGGWDTEALLPAGQTARGSTLVADENGALHAAYVDDDAAVRYLGRDATSDTWGEAVVVGGDARMSGEDGVSLAVGPDGSVHVVYSDAQSLDVRYVVGRRTQ